MQVMSGDTGRREVHPSHVVLGTGLTVTLAATALCDPPADVLYPDCTADNPPCNECRDGHI